jgi:hypothetical protein
MRGEGQVEFIYTGRGQGFVFDGGGSKFNLLVDGIRFAPSPNGTDTLVLKAIHHSLFRVKAYGAGPPIKQRQKQSGWLVLLCMHPV